MQHITSQLRAVRRSGRVLLVLRRLAQLLMVLAPLAVALGLLDYALRLPGPMRLLIGLAVLAGAGVWLVTRMNRALRFWPSLAELALRAERLYPQLAGSLASAMEFSLQSAEYENPTSTASMARSAIAEMEDKSKGIDVKRMLNVVPTLRTCALALLAVGLLAGVCSVTPQASATAAKRWLMPLGQTQWPKVNRVEALTADGAVFVADSKLRLRAQVAQGWTEGMLMTIQYRVLDESGEGQWESIRVAEQRGESTTDQHIYETMLDVPPAVARSLMAGQRQTATLEVRYTAGDDTTQTQSLTLAARPEISEVVVKTTAPRYALPQLGQQRIPLHEQPDRIASTSAYIGSTVALEVRFNKPIPRNRAAAAAENWRAQLGDDAQFALSSTDDLASGFTLTWVLRQTVTGSFALTDGFGLTSTDSEKQYRIQAIRDELPTVVLLRPAINESVLPGAAVDLLALAEDDVAVRSLQLEIVVPDRANTPEDATQIATRIMQGDELLITGSYESLQLEHILNLAGLDLLPGDEVLITAVGQDVYDLPGFDDARPASVRSETRRLTVITEQELADQIRRTLRGVRNTAQSLEREQRIVAGRTEDGQPAETAEQQAQIGRRIAAQQDTIDAVRERLDRNEPRGLEGLQDLLDRSEELLDTAQDASQQAEQSLSQATANQQDAQSARQGEQQATQAGESEQAQQAQAQQEAAQAQAAAAQEEAREQLAELVAALDMGESVGEIESQLSRIRADADRVARETRQLLPRTIGQKPEDLSEEVRRALEENAEDQRELGEDIEELIDAMRATAEQIGENGETPEQRATARTLSEAADTANREGLQENTEQAAQELGENQISDAATRQQQALQTLDQMLEELGQQQQRRQEELGRLLQEMEQKIQSLVNEQREQLDRAQQSPADAMALLEQPQFALRRRTMTLEAQAMQSSETAPVGEALGEAVRDQAQAVTAIRLSDKQAAIVAETEALARLEEALALIREQQAEQQQEQNRAERFALRQAYYDLADRQNTLRGILGQHERDAGYERRDWRQINALYEDELDERPFDEEQLAIRARATELMAQAGEAMVYQSLHRRIDRAANRAESRLSGRTIDRQVRDDQLQVSQMLRSMGDALDDTADPEKFENDNGNQEEQGPGGEGSPGGDPPLVPDLAQIKLLREVMISLRAQTARLDEQADTLTPEQRRQELADLAELQTELRDLGEQLVEQLRQQMQPPEQEPRN